MKIMNFVVGSISWIQYFIPLVIEGNKRKVQSIFFIRANPKKYANPIESSHFEQVKTMAKKFNVKLMDMNEITNYPTLTFLMEGDISGTSESDINSSGLFNLSDMHLKVSLTFNADFIWTYPKYIKYIDYAILPGRTFATAYGHNSPKNIFIGSPKFDIKLNPIELYAKYNLNPKNKHVIFFYPKKKWINSSPVLENHEPKMLHIAGLLKRLGFKIILKTREKDRVTNKIADYYFEEIDVFPNTSIELLSISNLAVMFSSATVEECVMMDVPVIDFKVDTKFTRFEFLYNPSFSKIISDINIPFESFKPIVDHITRDTPDVKVAFEDTRKQHMFTNANVSARILDRFTREADERYNNAQLIYKKIAELKANQN